MTTQAQSIVHKVTELAVLPQVVHQIINLTNNPNANARDLERLIGLDQGMSMRVLNTVNSAYYGMPRKIASIKDAVVLLGFKSVRHIAMTVSVFDLFVGKTDRQNLRRGKWWRHAIDTALCCRLIASQTHDLSPDEGYTLGLLHDIGKPLLDRYGEQPYECVENLVAQGLSELEAEQSVYGTDHAEVGEAVCLHWGFPEKLAYAVGEHHAEQPEGLMDARMTALVALGNAFAHWLRSPDIPESEFLFQIPEWILQTLHLQPNQLGALRMACASEMKTSPLATLSS